MEFENRFEVGKSKEAESDQEVYHSENEHDENENGFERNSSLKKKSGVKNMFTYHDLNAVMSSKRERKPLSASFHSEISIDKKPKKKKFIGLPKKKVKLDSNENVQLNKIYQSQNANTNILDVSVEQLFSNEYQKNYAKNGFIQNNSVQSEVKPPLQNFKVHYLTESSEPKTPSIQITHNSNGKSQMPEVRRNVPLDFTNSKESNKLIEPETISEKIESSLLPETQLTIYQNQDDAESRRNLSNLVDEIHQIPSFVNHTKSFINCDIRYINLDYLIEKLGDFDVVLIDPPWRIKGGQQNDSSFMFSNNNFSLGYDTMSNQEIMNLKIGKLSKKGFLFLWILNTQMNVAYEIMEKWGYEVVDQIIWVKLKDKKIFTTQGYYFMHSFEICLVGYKCPEGQVLEYCSKISNNLIFAEVRKKSQKPDELYEIIELMMPGAKKVEIFARNHNLRPGWLSLGNELGDVYDKWENVIDCNECGNRIQYHKKRFKSRVRGNYDICESCLESKGFPRSDFLELQNNVMEEVIHQYHKCNKCEVEPLWGIRFSCKECQDFDLCEVCFDLNLEEGKNFHDLNHQMETFEFPLLSSGLPTHTDIKCNGCYQKPIIGICISCVHCSFFNLCFTLLLRPKLLLH